MATTATTPTQAIAARQTNCVCSDFRNRNCRTADTFRRCYYVNPPISQERHHFYRLNGVLYILCNFI